MTILEGTVKHDYIVTDIVINEAVMRRLASLGINSGTKLQMLNQKKNGTVIIKVRGTRWAMGRDIAGGSGKSELWEDDIVQCLHWCKS